MIRTFATLAAFTLFAAGPAFAQDKHDDHHPKKEHHDGHEKGHDHEHDHEHDGETVDAAALSSEVRAAVAGGGDLIVADVLGVVCDFCATAMNKTFGKREEVAAVYVDLDRKTLNLVVKPGATLDDEMIKKLVKKSGYKLKDVRRGVAIEDALDAEDADAAARS